MNRAGDGVFVVSPQGRLVYFNSAAELLTGFTAQEVIGLQCRSGTSSGEGGPEDLAAALAPPPEAQAGQPAMVPVALPRPGGRCQRRMVLYVPLRGSGGRPLGTLGIFQEQAAESIQRAEPDEPPESIRLELTRLRHELFHRYGTGQVVAVDEPMRRVLEQVRLAAACDAGVAIWGERGTGKATLAKTIHSLSPRRGGPFIAVDCALLPPDVLEQDLFGYGGRADPYEGPARAGLIEQAVGGTLLIRNLGHMPRDVQARLAALLERIEQEFAQRHEGISQPPEAQAQRRKQIAEPTQRIRPIRLIATDRVDPARLMAEDRLRPDLYFLVTTISIHMPPLRLRHAELPLLAQECVEQANAAGDKQVRGLSAAALELLQLYDWPGNLRELDEVIRSAHGRCDGSVIQPAHLPLRIREPGAEPVEPPRASRQINLDEVLLNAERKLIELALRKAKGNKSQAAQMLSISRARLYRRMVQLGLEEPAPGEPAGTGDDRHEQRT